MKKTGKLREQDKSEVNHGFYKIDFRCHLIHNLYNNYQVILKVIYMEKNLDVYIRKLIELDSRAVELKKQRDAELLELTTHGRNELKGLDTVLEEAVLTVKQKHDEIIGDAKRQAREMDEAARITISELETFFSGFKEAAAKDIWKQLLDIER